MDTAIKNFKSDLYQQLLNEVLASNIKNNKKEIERFLRNRLNLTTPLSKHTNGYWLYRGWDEKESYVKSKENKQKNCKSVYGRQTWLEKINPATNKNYTIIEADFERNSRRPIRKEYWINKGYTEDEAVKLAINTKIQNNKKGSEQSVKSNMRRVTSKRCKEYYTIRGYSVKEATDMVSNNQRLFSKEICIKKYGKLDGLAVWQARQNSWQTTLNAKSTEEKARINRLKLTKGITVSNAEKIILEKIKLTIPTVIHQFTLSHLNKKQYIYDIMANNKIIEYHGDFWHSNPMTYSPDFINPRTKIKAIDKWHNDNKKLQYARARGYDILVIWESDFKKNREETIDKCIQFLTH